MQHGKQYRKGSEGIDRTKVYALAEAIQFVRDHAFAKFDEAVELHIKLSIDPKKTDQQIRATVSLPHGVGRTKKVAVATTAKAAEAKEAAADLIGGDDLVTDIKDGKVVPGVDFDVLLATPEMMPKLASVAKILGPKGLMPNPKNETVTQKVKETVLALKQGSKVSFKSDDGGNIHQVVGKRSFEAVQLEENIRAVTDAMHRAKPDSVKGKLVASAALCSTMGPSLKVSL